MSGGKGIGTFGRLRLGLGSLLGSASARESQEALRRLDGYRNWHEFTFGGGGSASGAGQDGTHGEGPPGGYRADLAALERFGGEGRRGRASAVARDLAAAEREALDRLARGYAAVEAGRAAAATQEAEGLEQLKESASRLFHEYRELAEAHRRAQREAWDRLATSGAAARAALLAEEVAALPDIPQLPRPDVSAFAEPYRGVLERVPEAYRAGEVDAIGFDPVEVERLAAGAVAAAPEAEAALTRYLYDVVRGYEAALGKERAARLLETLRDPAAVRDLRARRPALFDAEPALAGTSAFGFNLFPLLLMASLFSANAPGWQPYPGYAGAGGAPGADGGAPDRAGEGGSGFSGLSAVDAVDAAEVDRWLGQYDVPSAAEVSTLLAEAEAAEAAEALYDAEGAEDAEMESDVAGVDGDVDAGADFGDGGGFDAE